MREILVRLEEYKDTIHNSSYTEGAIYFGEWVLEDSEEQEKCDLAYLHSSKVVPYCYKCGKKLESE